MSKLKSKLVKGLTINSLSSAVTMAAQAARYFIILRLINPSELGAIAPIFAIVGILEQVSDGGVANRIVTVPNLRRTDTVAIEATNQLLSWLSLPIIAWACIYLTAPSNFSALEIIVACGSILIGYLCAAATRVRASRLRRYCRFNSLLLAEGFAQLTAVVALAAIAGFSGMAALCASYALREIVRAFALVTPIVPIRSLRVFALNPRRYAKVFGEWFSSSCYQLGERAIAAYSSTIDVLALSGRVQPGELGTYIMAGNIVHAPSTRLSSVVNQTMLPVVSRNGSSRTELYHATLSRVGAVQAIVCGTVAAIAPGLAGYINPSWSLNATMLAFIATANVGRSLMNVIGTSVLASGLYKESFVWNLGHGVVVTLLVGVGVWAAGTFGAAVALAIHYAISVVAARWLLLPMCVNGFRPRQYWISVARTYGLNVFTWMIVTKAIEQL